MEAFCNFEILSVKIFISLLELKVEPVVKAILPPILFTAAISFLISPVTSCFKFL